jgi:glyoxylase-like metal-dependent hydrolase (beta-lactamase superfamily II)
MRVHHLNCVSACPLGGLLMDGLSASRLRGRLTSHCLLVEAGSELVLVDTGYGLRDVHDPRGRLSKFFLAMNKPAFREEMTAVRQVRRLGFDPADVRHVVLTHLDFDHAGGLDDFPHARVHLLADERDAALSQATVLDRMRYRPQQWSTRANWRAYGGPGGEPWFGFDCVRGLDGLPPEIVLVPLVGHTLGHAGVAVRRERDWLLLAGDAYFYHAEMDPVRPRCTPGLRFYQTLMEKDRRARLLNQARLRALRRARGGEVTVVCSHDVREFERAARRPYDAPAGRARPLGEGAAGRPERWRPSPVAAPAFARGL